MRRVLRGILTLSAVMVLTFAALPASAAPADEAAFVNSINQSRSAAGLAPLTTFWDLADDARVHTAEMMAAGQIYHSSNSQLAGYSTGWALLGENVGMGPNPSLLHQAFMNSPSHRANILGDYDLVGVGADRSGDGTMFVTVVFMKSAAPAPATTTTTAPPPTTTTAPPTTAPPTTAPPVTAPPTTAPPTSTPPTTAPVRTPPSPGPTTTTQPSSTTTTAQDAQTERASSLDRFTEAVAGPRPAAKASHGVFTRDVGQFRPIFALLDRVGSEPLVVHTSSGVPVTIE